MNKQIVLINFDNLEFSKIAGEWLDSIELIPNEFKGCKKFVRSESEKIISFIKANSDVKPCGTVCTLIYMSDLLKYSKSYAVLINKLPEDVQNAFRHKFSHFWLSLCRNMKFQSYYV